MADTSACAGGEHTLFYNSTTKSLFSAGACGLGWCRNYPLNEALFRLQKVSLGAGGKTKPIRLFRASYYHNLAIDDSNGQLYSWGCGTFVDLAKDGKPNLDGVIPALGQGPDATDLGGLPKPIALVPKDIRNTKDPIVGLAAGAYHSVVLTRLGIVYTFGAGQLGQLGRPLAPEHTDSSGLPVDPTPLPVRGLPVEGDDDDDDEGKVMAIGAGFYNTFAVVGSSGTLYCAGENQNQQCGEGPLNLREMVRVKEIKDAVDKVEGGYCHTLVKTIAGRAFSLGCGEEGQRGDGRLIDEDSDENTGDNCEQRKIVTPVVLPNGRKAIDIAAGANHSVVLGDDGVAYTFGANDAGQCGVSSVIHGTDSGDDHNEEEEGGPVLSPRAVDIPSDAGRVIGVSAGYAHTVLTTSKERVFVFGQNDNGQLGISRKGLPRDCELDSGPSLRPVEVNIERR